MMKFLKYLFFGMVALFALGSVLQGLGLTPKPAPPDPNQAKYYWRDANVIVAQRAVRSVLKDPDSAKFSDVVVVASSYHGTDKAGLVCGEVNARNSFGAFTGNTSFMVIYGLPMVDNHGSNFRHLWNKECAGKDVL